MASNIPLFDYDQTHLSQFQSMLMVGGGGNNNNMNGGGHDVRRRITPLWAEEIGLVNPNYSLFENNFAFDQIVSSSSESDASSSVMTMSPYPHQYGPISDMIVPSFPEELDILADIHGINDGIINSFSSCNNGNQPAEVSCEFREDCCGFVPELKPNICPVIANHNWGLTQSNQMPVIEEANIKACRYTEEERKERILRYLKKRNQRNFSKTIKYACRKTLADRRVRVRGRFARNSTELCDPAEIMSAKNNNNLSYHNARDQLYPSESVQMKQDDHEEEWLQEIASLMYYPYFTMAEQLDLASS